MRFRIIFCVLCFALLSISSSALSAPVRDTYNALYFDGVDDFVKVADPIQCTTGPLTLEAWVWLGSLNSGGRIVGNRFGGDGYEMDIYPAVGGGFKVRLTFNGGVLSEAIINVQAREWTHLAATWAGTTVMTVKLYANGEVVDSTDMSNEIAPTSGSVVIGSLRGDSNFFEGTIDDVRIWSVAVDQATIQAWMIKPIDASHPNFANLEGYWPFDEGTGQVAISLTHSPDRDGQLGSAVGEDSSDPTWTTNVSPVPVELTTFGRIKGNWFIRR
jgi:hypothetical protein